MKKQILSLLIICFCLLTYGQSALTNNMATRQWVSNYIYLVLQTIPTLPGIQLLDENNATLVGEDGSLLIGE